MSKYQWQGEPVQVEFGYVNQKENLDKPLYWYNYECAMNKVGAEWKHKFALIPACKVTSSNGSMFLLANMSGIGVHKLLNGGWPNYAHFSLDGEFHQSDERMWAIKSFNEDEYSERESKRRNWQKIHCPVEFERSEKLREAFKTMHRP